jgi:4-oxalomesaconate tautomerase
MTSPGVRCMLMRGGTSKGAYFLAQDLPGDRAERDDLLLRIMGSPDPRQIDGIGGAHPLTSKVAIVSPSADPSTDVDYLFLQVGVDTPTVSDRQNCGNLLAGVGPFAVERGLVPATGTETRVRIRMLNTGGIATAVFATTGSGTGDPRAGGNLVQYAGDTAIDGVPGTASAVVLDFADGAAGPLLPTGNVSDVLDGIPVTCVDNGMPVVVVAASSLGRTGYEPVAELEADAGLAERVRSLRLEAGKAMGLGDVSDTTVPKVSLVAAPASGGTICTRTFIPVRVHQTIGVLGAVSVATAIRLDGAVGHDLAAPAAGPRLGIEHPGGITQVEVEVDTSGSPPRVLRSGVVRTARRLFDGTVYPR